MLTIYNCIVYDHDLRLVLLAVVVCTLASFAAISLLNHVRKSSGAARLQWLAVSAASIGFGIWATHFIAMLAFSPEITVAYSVGLTVLSLLLAIGLTGAGMGLAVSRTDSYAYLAGGAIIGTGIAAMHYTGMAAYKVEGHLEWHQLYVAASLVGSVVLGALSLYVALRGKARRNTLFAGMLLTLAICSLHFTGMAAVTVVMDASAPIPVSAINSTLLAIGVALVSLGVLIIAGAALWLDLREQQLELETMRMHALANAAVEGILVCDGQTIVSANDSFCSLAGLQRDKIVGRPMREFFSESLGPPAAPMTGVHESQLLAHDGSVASVELIARTIDYCDKPHTVVAVRDIRERKRAQADIMRLANHDPLTGLPNRRSFSNKLGAEIGAMTPPDGRYLALLCLDLDRFKEVNDIFGHSAGDALLQRVAQAVTAVLREGQMLARLGGDEFAVILPGLRNPTHAGRVADDILAAIRNANEGTHGEGIVSTSIGIAVYPSDASNLEALISHADTALYRAKAEGRNMHRFFEAAMGVQERERRLIEYGLRNAIDRGEMGVVYQPQKRIDSRETIGYEALVRWYHPQRGEIDPSYFIPIAEESGAIIQIGEWVMRTACFEAATWQSDMTIAVNVSPVQLHGEAFPLLVQSILLASGLQAHRLEIEITETALIKDLNRALVSLRRLKSLGVKVTMDDFGTGYSSLANLRAFPFDKIKIDRSFIRSVDTNEQAAAIVRAVVGLGRGLGCPVLAEGVETQEELEFLRLEDCHMAQGYFLGRPSPSPADDDEADFQMDRIRVSA
ncbi:EAL domain-containing protein [Corticibacterium sp. UT-5YL-CI-8]|nr:EAL domain-containing protein [Tianweitania sp. UT-5YL-CI-8]